jgi:hypothetical protein
MQNDSSHSFHFNEVTYDNADGWFDHVAGPIINFSQDPPNDAIWSNPATSTGACGNPGPGLTITIQDRCGYDVRLPFVLISPYSKRNCQKWDFHERRNHGFSVAFRFQVFERKPRDLSRRFGRIGEKDLCKDSKRRRRFYSYRAEG